METIARPHGIVDQVGARALVVTEGEIRFEAIGFNYGSAKGLPGADPARVIDGLSLTILPGEKVGLIGRSGAGNQRSSTCFCASMTWRRAQHFD